MAILPNGDVIAGGEFTSAGGVSASNIARFNPTTNTWSALGTGVNNAVYALAVAANGDVIVGGSFTVAGDMAASRLARYNPTAGSWSEVGTGIRQFNGHEQVRAVVVLPGGDILVSGDFVAAGTVPAGEVARYNPTTDVWSAPAGILGFEFPPAVMSVLPGGDTILGGSFAYGNGQYELNRLARYNSNTNEWSNVGAGVSNGHVAAIAVLADGKMIVGGSFSRVGGTPPAGLMASRIAQYNPATDAWLPLGAGVLGNVFALATLPGGDVIAGGAFITAGGVAGRRYLARCSPSTGQWSGFGTTTNGSILALAVLPCGDLIMGGSFTTAGGHPSPHFARYTFGGMCAADFNCSGAATIEDLFIYLNAWFTGANSADIDGDGASSPTIDDLFQFLNLWFTGC